MEGSGNFPYTVSRGETGGSVAVLVNGFVVFPSTCTRKILCVMEVILLSAKSCAGAYREYEVSGASSLSFTMDDSTVRKDVPLYQNRMSSVKASTDA